MGNFVKRGVIVLTLMAGFLAGLTSGRADSPSVPGHVAVLAGAGESIPGWGGTRERVKTIDLTLRHAGLIDRRLGPDRFALREQLWLELPVFLVYEPHAGRIYSLNVLFCAIYERFKNVQPYLTLGGGPVYADVVIPGMGSRLCGNYQAGVGLRLPFARWSAHIEMRYHHISNLGLADPNEPLNSLHGMVGVSWSL
jgi:hypothetical protein